MNLLNRLGWQFRGKVNQTPWPIWARGTAQAQEWNEFGGAGIDYKTAANDYSSSDLVFMCVKKLGDMATDGQLLLYPRNAERDKLTGLPSIESALEFDQHPFYQLWMEPNPQDSKAEFLEALIITLLLSPKGAFIHLDDGQRPTMQDKISKIELSGEPVAMWWLSPEAMTINPSKTEYIESYLHEVAGVKTLFDPAAIMRLAEFNPSNRYISISRLDPVRLAVNTDKAAQFADMNLYKNGMRPSALLQSDRDHIDRDELALLEKVWGSRMSGADNWYKPFFIWAGFQFQQLTMTPQDAQSNETAARNRMRIFGTFGVHPGVILSEDVNLANAKVAEHVTRAFTLRPLLRRVADEITAILPNFQGQDTEAHFVNVVPQDQEAEAQIEKLKSDSVASKAQALSSLTQTFGPDTAVEVGKEWGILPQNITPQQFMAELPEQVERGAVRYQSFSGKNHIVPVLPQVPFNVAISESDIGRALADFYDDFPEYTGVLETGLNGRNGNGR